MEYELWFTHKVRSGEYCLGDELLLDRTQSYAQDGNTSVNDPHRTEMEMTLLGEKKKRRGRKGWILLTFWSHPHNRILALLIPGLLSSPLPNLGNYPSDAQD